MTLCPILWNWQICGIFSKLDFSKLSILNNFQYFVPCLLMNSSWETSITFAIRSLSNIADNILGMTCKVHLNKPPSLGSESGNLCDSTSTSHLLRSFQHFMFVFSASNFKAGRSKLTLPPESQAGSPWSDFNIWSMVSGNPGLKHKKEIHIVMLTFSYHSSHKATNIKLKSQCISYLMVVAILGFT